MNEGQIITDKACFVTEIGPDAIAHLLAVKPSMIIYELTSSSEPSPTHAHEIHIRRNEAGGGLHVMTVPGCRPDRDEFVDPVESLALSKAFSVHGSPSMGKTALV